MDIAHIETDKEIARIERKLRKHYRQSKKELKKKTDDYFEAFRRKQKKKLKDLRAGKITKAEYQTWATNQMLIGKRWEEMRNELVRDMTHANQIAQEIYFGSMPKVYSDNYNYAGYQIEQASGVETSFVLYDRDTVARLVKEDPDLLPIIKTKAVGKRAERWNKQKFTSAITQSILQGESVEHTAERLQDVVGMNYRSAVRNARTALTSAENAGRIKAYDRAEEMGLNPKKEWVATLDERTRTSHRELDGMVIDVDETFPNGCMYPADPMADPKEVYNCRCTLIARFDDVAIEQNRSFKKIEPLTYDEWKEGR